MIFFKPKDHLVLLIEDTCFALVIERGREAGVALDEPLIAFCQCSPTGVGGLLDPYCLSLTK